MNTMKRIPSCLAALAAVAIIALPIMGGPVGWRERLDDPRTLLTALAFAGVALALWPLGENNPPTLAEETHNLRPEMRRTS